jgi:hypothetical protein
VCTTSPHPLMTAWPVNFNMELSAFEPTVAGVENIVLLSLASKLAQLPRIVFLSTFSAILSESEVKILLDVVIDCCSRL